MPKYRFPVESLNYHHLRYFWLVAREGGLAPAAKLLKLAPPTLSGQVRELEEAVGEKLFRRDGRRLVLTEVGRIAFGYADQIFGLGRELLDTLEGRAAAGSQRLVVGVVDAVPRTFVARLLRPVLEAPGGARLVIKEDAFDRLLQELAGHGLDLIVADVPVPPGSGVRAFNHEVAESGVTFFASPSVLGRLVGPFPGCLRGAPFLLPGEGTPLRRSLDRWLAHADLHVQVVGEIGDAALTKVLCSEGRGVCVAPTLIEDAVATQYSLQPLGRTEEIRERFFLVTAERRIRHAITLEIMEKRPFSASSALEPAVASATLPR